VVVEPALGNKDHRFGIADLNRCLFFNSHGSRLDASLRIAGASPQTYALSTSVLRLPVPLGDVFVDPDLVQQVRHFVNQYSRGLSPKKPILKKAPGAAAFTREFATIDLHSLVVCFCHVRHSSCRGLRIG
jgi:hypothetical protein